VTNNTNSTLYDVAQVGEDVDRICIVSNVTGRIIENSPFFDRDEIDDARAFCRLLEAAYKYGRDGNYMVDEHKIGRLINAAIVSGAARKGRRA